MDRGAASRRSRGDAEPQRSDAEPKRSDAERAPRRAEGPGGDGRAAREIHPPARTEERSAKHDLDRAFSEIYRAHLRDVYSYAYYRIGNHHDAEDITEQTFLQAYRHFERALRESKGRPLRPWLIRIAHNLAANYYRDRSRRPQTQLEDAAVLSDIRRTDELVESREEVGRVLEGVAELPDDRREALIMRFALDMDNREIARALGRSEGATKVLLHRAIRQLDQRLKEEAS